LKPASGYGRICPGDGYLCWSNHAAFLWREHGVSYVATLHNFGPETTRLLGRLVAGLRPTRQLPRQRPRGVGAGVSPNSLVAIDEMMCVAALGDRTPNFRETIFRFRTGDSRPGGRIQPGRTPHALTSDGTTLWVVTDVSVVRVDARSGRPLATVEAGRWPRAIAVGHEFIWVVNSTPPVRGVLLALHRRTHRVVARVPLGRAPVAPAVTVERSGWSTSSTARSVASTRKLVVWSRRWTSATGLQVLLPARAQSGLLTPAIRPSRASIPKRMQ
jgi:hypothetical protein